jgi:diguanylate cyclase (GGDEF)-like protein
MPADSGRRESMRSSRAQVVRRAGRGTQVVGAMALVLLVGVSTMFRIRALDRWESSRHEVVLALTEVNTVTERYSALEWSTIAGATELAKAEQDVPSLRRHFDALTATILRLAGGGEKVVQLRVAFNAYQVAVSQVFSLLHGGWYDDARRLDLLVVVPVFENLKHEVERQRREEADRASAADAAIMRDTSWMLGGALLLIVLIISALTRARILAARRQATQLAVEASEKRFRHQAYHDALTGLANRTLLFDRIDHALARCARGKPSVAVLLLDLDGFKAVNDRLGHSAGDQLLVSVAEELRQCLRPGDTVARLGGDEFAIVLEDLIRPEDAEVAAARILEALRRSMPMVGGGSRVTASIGVALAAGEETGATDLLRNADAAMYAAKRQGKNRLAVFDPDMRSVVLEPLLSLPVGGG